MTELDEVVVTAVIFVGLAYPLGEVNS